MYILDGHTICHGLRNRSGRDNKAESIQGWIATDHA